MNPAARISAEDAFAISTASAEFGSRVDRGRATDCAELFTADAKLIFGPGSPKPGELAGIDAIRQFLVARQAQTHVTTRHLATNFRFEDVQADQVRVLSLLTVFRSEDASREPVVTSVSDIEEVFSRAADGTWRIQSRRTTPVFVKS